MTDIQRATELRQWWSFGDGQQHTHSYHCREDYIDKVFLPMLREQQATISRLRAEYEAAIRIVIGCHVGRPWNQIRQMDVDGFVQRAKEELEAKT